MEGVQPKPMSCFSRIVGKSQARDLPRWTRVQWWILLSQCMILFLSTLAFALPVAFFPQEAEKKGVSSHTGLILGCYELVIFLTSPIYGALIVRLGPRYLSLAGSALSIAASLSFGFLNSVENPSSFVALCLCARCIEANGCAMLTVAAMTVLSTSFPDQVNTVNSLADMFIGLGYMLGPLAGAVMFEIGGYSAPFLAIGGIFLLTSITGYIYQPKSDSSCGNRSGDGTFLKLLLVPGIALLYVHSVGSSIALTFLDPILGSWLQTKHSFSQSSIGLVFLLWSGVYTVSAPAVGKLSDEGYIYSNIIGGYALCVLALFLLGPASILSDCFHITKHFSLVLFSFVLLGAGCAGIMVPLYAACLHQAELAGFVIDMKTYGFVAGMTSSSYSLGAFLGPTISSYVKDSLGFEWTCAMFALLLCSISFLLMTSGVAIPSQKNLSKAANHQ